MKYKENQSISYHNNALFDKFRSLNIPLGEYAIVSGGPLAIRGIRKTNDVDVIVTTDLWNTLKDKYGNTYYGPHKVKLITPIPDVDFFCAESLKKLRGTLPKDEPTAEEQIDNAEIINGLSFQSLRDCLWFKKNQEREKDIIDIELTKKYLETHPAEMAKIDFML